MLDYQPPDRKLQMCVMHWDRVSKKTCFLDDIIKTEKVKLAPGKYASHDKWSEKLSKTVIHGHTRKGVFNPRDRPSIF